jgi:hypothetical protein
MNYLQKKKLAFMSIVNKVKGFVRNIVGLPPLTLPNCVDEDSVIDYKIYGESVQNGTPSPDAPVEIESVGVRTKNILDVKKAPIFHSNPYEPTYTWERTDMGFKTSSLTAKEAGGSARFGFYIGTAEELKGKTIAVSVGEYIGKAPYPTLAFICTSVSGETAFNFDGVSNYATGNINAPGLAKSLGSKLNTYSLTCTIPETTDYPNIGVMFYTEFNAGAIQVGDTTEYKNIQVEISDTPTEYEPYGYKIPVRAKGKNMVKPVDGTYGKNNTGATVKDGQIIIHNIEPVNAGSTFAAYEIPCEFIQGEIGKTYVMCWGNGVKISDKGNSRLQIEFEDGTKKTLYGNWGASNRIKFTLTSLITKVLITIAVVDTGIYLETPFTIQLEEGEVVSDYEPYVEPITTNIYLDEPLASGEVISYPKDDVPRLPTFKGTTVLEIDTDIQPSNMEVSYYSSQKGE